MLKVSNEANHFNAYIELRTNQNWKEASEGKNNVSTTKENDPKITHESIFSAKLDKTNYNSPAFLVVQLAVYTHYN